MNLQTCKKFIILCQTFENEDFVYGKGKMKDIFIIFYHSYFIHTRLVDSFITTINIFCFVHNAYEPLKLL